MAISLQIIFFVCAVVVASAHPLEDKPSEDGDRKHHVSASWRGASAVSPTDKKHHISVTWKEAQASDKKHHITVSWKGAEVASPAEEAQSRRKGFTVSWKGAQLEPAHPLAEEGQDRKHHFTVSWRNASAEAPAGAVEEKKHHITFSWRAAPGANVSDEVGPDGRIHWTFHFKKEGLNGETATEKRGWWSFIPLLFSRAEGAADTSANDTTSGDEAVRKHHVTFSWRNSPLEPEISTDAGSQAGIEDVASPAVASSA